MRQDIHRPSAIVPTDYEFVALRIYGTKFSCLDDLLEVNAWKEVLRKHMERTGGTYSTHEHGGNCDCCGASFNYGSVYYHAKTNSYIKIGWICADKMELSVDSGEKNRFKMSVKSALEFRAGKQKAKKILEDANLLTAWNLYEENNPENYKFFEERTIIDIVSKLVRYGSMSDNQQNFMKKLVEQISNRNEILKQREIEKAERKANRKEFCEGQKIHIKGKVVKSEVGDAYAYAAPRPQRITMIDENYGLLWFQSTAEDVKTLKRGDEIEGIVYVRKILEDIAFCNRPKLSSVKYTEVKAV